MSSGIDPSWSSGSPTPIGSPVSDPSSSPIPGRIYSRVHKKDFEVGRQVGKGTSKRVLIATAEKVDKAFVHIDFQHIPEEVRLQKREALEFDVALTKQLTTLYPKYFGAAIEEVPSLLPHTITVLAELFPNNVVKAWEKNLLEENEKVKILHHVATGYDLMHKEGYIHNDVKLENILLRDNLEAVVTDFDHSLPVKYDVTKIKNEQIPFRGSAGKIAPEILRKEYSQKADVFSFGLVIYEFIQNPNFCGDWDRDPFHQYISNSEVNEDFVNPDTFSQYQNEMLEKIATEFEVNEFPKEVNEVLARIVRDCTQYDPEQRPTMADIAKRMEDEIPEAKRKAKERYLKEAAALEEQGKSEEAQRRRGWAEAIKEIVL